MCFPLVDRKNTEMIFSSFKSPFCIFLGGALPGAVWGAALDMGAALGVLPWLLPWLLPVALPWALPLAWAGGAGFGFVGNLTLFDRKGESISYAGSVGRSGIIFCSSAGAAQAAWACSCCPEACL